VVSDYREDTLHCAADRALRATVDPHAALSHQYDLTKLDALFLARRLLILTLIPERGATAELFEKPVIEPLVQRTVEDPASRG
jgi:hypothetical protein